MNLRLSLIDIAALSPSIIVLFGALVILLIESFAEKVAKKLVAPVAILTIILALIATYMAPNSTNGLLTPWVKFDPMARFFTALFLLVGLASSLLADAFFKKFDVSKGEYFFLLLAAVLGLILIGISADFLMIFIGLETLSLALYILVGYMRKWEFSKEAALKYFILGALAAALFVYGVALVYGAVGSTGLNGLAQAYHSINTVQSKYIFLAGIALITVGLAFKAAIVPFHIWAPDVYEGAPNPVTAFMAVGTKAGAFAGFSRVFLGALPAFDAIWSLGVSILAMVTMVYANFVAMRQLQLRRFFAYSGISHAGYLLIPFVSGGPNAFDALAFYLVVYSLATLGAFAVLSYLDDSEKGVMIGDLQGLFYRSPWLAGTMTLFLLTLAGIPPTAGFLAKFYVFAQAFEAGYITLVAVALVTTILAAYYYLRIIGVMFSEQPEQAERPQQNYDGFFLALCCLIGIAALSIFPKFVLDFF